MKKLYSLALTILILLGPISSVLAANIIWVSDAPNNGGPFFVANDPAYIDHGWIMLLTNAGHNVLRYNPPDSSDTPLPAADLSALNTNDLVILSRTLGSGSFQNHTQATQWNTAVTVPVLSINAYLLRAIRLGWFVGSTLPDGTPTPVRALDLLNGKTAYLFSQVALNGDTTANPYDEAFARNTSHITEMPVTGGTVLARSAALIGGTNVPVVVDWLAGTVVRTNHILSSYRLYFAAGSRETNGGSVPMTAGKETLTATGESMFLKAVQLTINGGVVGGTNSPPVITSQPSSRSVDVGSDVTFAVSASGTFPLTYQWRRNEVALPSATGNTLTIFNVEPSDAGAYDVVVSNSAGSTNSDAAILTVLPGLPDVSSGMAFSVDGNTALIWTTEHLFRVDGTSAAREVTVGGSPISNAQSVVFHDQALVAAVIWTPDKLYLLTNSALQAVEITDAGQSIPAVRGVVTVPGSPASLTPEALIWNHEKLLRHRVSFATTTEQIHAAGHSIHDARLVTWRTSSAGPREVFIATGNELFRRQNDSLLAEEITTSSNSVSAIIGISPNMLATNALVWSAGQVLRIVYWTNQAQEVRAGLAPLTNVQSVAYFWPRGECLLATFDQLFIHLDGTLTAAELTYSSNSISSVGGITYQPQGETALLWTPGQVFRYRSGAGTLDVVTAGGMPIPAVNGIVHHPSGSEAMVLTSNKVLVLMHNDLAAHEVTASAASISGARGSVYDPSGNIALIWTSNGVWRRVSGSSTAEQLTTAGGAMNADGIVFSPAGHAFIMGPDKVFRYSNTGGLSADEITADLVGGGTTSIVSYDPAQAANIVAMVHHTGAGSAGSSGASAVGLPASSFMAFAGSSYAGAAISSSVQPKAFSTIVSAQPAPNAMLILNPLQLPGTLSGNAMKLLAFRGPVITFGPLDQTIQSGNEVTFQAFAIGLEPLGFQWFHNGAAIAGANQSSLTVPNVQIANAGKYSVSVSNVAGTIESKLADLWVVEILSAPTLHGPYTLNTSARLNSIGTAIIITPVGPSEFFQLRSSEETLFVVTSPIEHEFLCAFESLNNWSWLEGLSDDALNALAMALQSRFSEESAEGMAVRAVLNAASHTDKVVLLCEALRLDLVKRALPKVARIALLAAAATPLGAAGTIGHLIEGALALIHLYELIDISDECKSLNPTIKAAAMKLKAATENLKKRTKEAQDAKPPADTKANENLEKAINEFNEAVKEFEKAVQPP